MQDNYLELHHSMSQLELPLSSSGLHGNMCGYLCAGARGYAEKYFNYLLTQKNNAENARAMANMLFEIYTLNQVQIENLDCEFQLLLPDDDEPLPKRAAAFAAWCVGFTQAMKRCGIQCDTLQDEEAQDALLHITEFGNINHDTLDISEQDEQALMEVIEYTRIAVLHIRQDLSEQEATSTIRRAAH